ncbi:UDP-2,4-diacetamido-2,4,6-trideoxy-beta-L-altropyranose hydrolase, partial [Candidatus Roizmanbacteria bacterium]|nr:UDP-2,4-diacetamido-2,4,6-trideoxy-beta-L-altropyranose hydrolase [Candidatus Roizmanbacteria bacterium]
MRFFFRVDASFLIGTGHVMRCLTLADALRKQGANCYFVCRAHIGNLLNLIQQRGYQTYSLPVLKDQSHHDKSLHESTLSTHSSWLGTDLETDANQTLTAIGERYINWLIVDHYALDIRWEKKIRHMCCRLMVIDDLANRPHDCDLLLDQNLGRSASDYTNLVSPSCELLIGPQYALLRPEFSALRSYSINRRTNLEFKHLLITMGGIDKDNATNKVLNALRNCILPADLKITVVIGQYAPWLEEVKITAAKMPWSTEVLVNVQNMAKLMADSDLAIGAAGSTSWERNSLGLPTLIIALAENQKAIAKALNVAGAAIEINYT